MRNLQTAVRLRPVDLAREHGLSTQAVRNYEAAGILPPADRTDTGYRAYTPRHAQALRVFLALLPGHGHGTAAAILRAVHDGDEAGALRLVDETHAQLLADRRTLRAVEDALRGLEPDARRAPHRGETFIGPLASRLRIRPATLRQWERAGLVRPRRDPATGYRVYDAAAVRDAELTHLLRRGGYRLEQIAQLVEQVRTAGGLEPLAGTLAGWHDRLTVRGRALLGGAAALEAYLRRYGSDGPVSGAAPAAARPA